MSLSVLPGNCAAIIDHLYIREKIDNIREWLKKNTEHNDICYFVN